MIGKLIDSPFKAKSNLVKIFIGSNDRKTLIMKVLVRLLLVVFMVLAAMFAKAEQCVTFSKIESPDAQHDLVTQKDFELVLGDRLLMRTHT